MPLTQHWGLGISRVWTGSLCGASLLAGPMSSSVEAYPTPTGRVDAAEADEGLICLGGSCVLHCHQVVEIRGWRTAHHLGYAEDWPSLPGANSAAAWATRRTRPMNLKRPHTAPPYTGWRIFWENGGGGGEVGVH